MSPGEEFGKFVEKLDVPILDIGEEIGHTQYIDFIKPEKVLFPVMKGIDIFSRPFIVIKASGSLEEAEKKDIHLFQTFFQRYTNDKCLWMGCGNHGAQLFETVGGMREHHFNALKRIIDKETVTTENFYRCDSLRVKSIRLI